MGRNLGENARAALITRGLHEMALLIGARGGAIKTVQSLSGLGDFDADLYLVAITQYVFWLCLRPRPRFGPAFDNTN